MVLVDGIVFTNNRQKGVQRYFFEMLSRAASKTEVSIFLDEHQAAPLPAHCARIVRSEHFWTSRAQIHLWAWRRLRRRLAPAKLPAASLFHTSYFTRSPLRGIPEVATVYDMIFERYPYYYGPDSESQALQKAASIRSAEHIIAISRSTADELIAFYPEARRRISIIYPGFEHLVRPPAAHVSTTAPRPYCLFVGYRFAYKNFTTLLDAMASDRWGHDLHLHVVGQPFLASELMLIKRMGLAARVRHLGHLSDAALGEAYRDAAVFVFPSLAEGFGIPILEAQSGGAPLACSDIPVFREIAGDAAEFFDPLDADSMAEAVARAAARGRTESLTAVQAENLARFSWDRCADETVRVWNAVAR